MTAGFLDAGAPLPDDKGNGCSDTGRQSESDLHEAGEQFLLVGSYEWVRRDAKQPGEEQVKGHQRICCQSGMRHRRRSVAVSR